MKGVICMCEYTKSSWYFSEKLYAINLKLSTYTECPKKLSI